MGGRHSADNVVRAVVGIVVLALGARFVFLGQRVAHWDEGRVAYWIVRTAASGAWEYRPIIHGPFVQHTTRAVFAVAGRSDATMRAVVALVGGTAPLAALLFRGHGPDSYRLGDAETVALALVLAANPLVVYYSRFLRSDVPLAAFALVAVGFAVRAIDTGRSWDLAWALLALALAATTKENVVLYLASWTGAGALTVAVVGYRRRREGTAVRPLLRRWGVATVSALRGRWAALAVGCVGAILVVVGFYAPRGGAGETAGLAAALAGRDTAAVVWAATVGSARRALDLWASGSLHGHAYAPYLAHYLLVAVVGAGATLAYAAVGALEGRHRPLVVWCLWWGLSAVVGYPYAADIKAPWLVVHAVVAFAIPAAVGLAAVWRAFVAAHRARNRRIAAVFAGVLVVSGLYVGVVAGATSYTYPVVETNVLAQSGQPGSDLRPVLDRMERAGAATDEGPAVLYYGELATASASTNDAPPADGGWYRRLPLPWYTERSGVGVTSAADAGSLPDRLPPVVVVRPAEEDELPPMADYRRYERATLLLGANTTVSLLGYERRFGGRSTVFYIREGFG